MWPPDPVLQSQPFQLFIVRPQHVIAFGFHVGTMPFPRHFASAVAERNPGSEFRV
jgi:hypothetical protein